MAHSLKVPLLAGLALGALSASAAKAAPKFTTGAGAGVTTEFRVLKDGTGKTAHQVLEIRNAALTESLSVTCNEAARTGTGVCSEPTDVTVPALAFQGTCTCAGQEVKIENTGWNFTFTADGILHIVNDGPANALLAKNRLISPTPSSTAKSNGRADIEGIKYHNLADGMVTGEMPEPKINYTTSGTGCSYRATTNGLLTTGNFIVEGCRGGAKVNISWDSV